MKKWIIASGLVLISLSTMAQQRRGGERPSPEERATRMTERMAESLELSEDQKKQVFEINFEKAKKRKSKKQKELKWRLEEKK